MLAHTNALTHACTHARILVFMHARTHAHSHPPLYACMHAYTRIRTLPLTYCLHLEEAPAVTHAVPCTVDLVQELNQLGASGWGEQRGDSSQGGRWGVRPVEPPNRGGQHKGCSGVTLRKRKFTVPVGVSYHSGLSCRYVHALHVHTCTTLRMDIPHTTCMHAFIDPLK